MGSDRNFEGVKMVKTFIHRFLPDQSGATAVEYALMAAMFSVLVMASFTVFRDSIIAFFIVGAAVLLDLAGG